MNIISWNIGKNVFLVCFYCAGERCLRQFMGRLLNFVLQRGLNGKFV